MKAKHRKLMQLYLSSISDSNSILDVNNRFPPICYVTLLLLNDEIVTQLIKG